MKKANYRYKVGKKLFQLKEFIVFKQYKIERKSFFDKKKQFIQKLEAKGRMLPTQNHTFTVQQ